MMHLVSAIGFRQFSKLLGPYPGPNVSQANKLDGALALMLVAEYRPKFVFWTSVLAQVPLQLFFAFWAGGFFGGLLTALLPAAAASMSRHVGSPFVTFGQMVLCLFPIATLSVKWLNYRNTVYRIYSDRIQIQEGFLTQHRKELQLSSIREISLRQGMLQRLVGLGSVYLASLATGQGLSWQSSATLGGTSTFGSGAMLMDLVDPEAAYEKLRGLLDARTAAAN
jgi:membrane protein YdbS with pleckstrin-like domain